MDLELTSDEFRALLRNDFYVFVMRCFTQLNPGTPFLPNWHIELIAAMLVELMLGKKRRLIINLPPRHLKSLIASVALPAFYLGHNPTAQIICVSYAQDLSEKLARDCRTIMTTDWYKAAFPRTRLSSQRQPVQELTTTRQGFRLATSVGGVLTGRGADLIIIDDPAKPDEAISESHRNRLNEWFKNTLLSRLNDKRNGRIAIISQRLHEDDLVGHVLSLDDWEVLRLPAIAEDEEEYEFETFLGRRRVTRRVGEPLHPEREPKWVLDNIRRSVGEWIFAGQYQQSPLPLGGGMVKREWFRTYGPEDLPERFDSVLLSVDTANKPSELSDYSAFTIWGVYDQRIYLLHVLRQRLEYPDLKRTVRALAERHKPDVILIEDRASGTQLIQELIDEGLCAVTRYAPEGDKQMRLYAQTAMIENGFFYLPREAPWLPEYLHEMLTFPNSKYDDQVDSTSQALDWIKRASRRDPVWTYIDQHTTLDRYHAGGTDVGIAEELRLPIRLVKMWIAEEEKNPPQSGLTALEALKEKLRKFCPACGKEILGDYIPIRGKYYHPECVNGAGPGQKPKKDK
jgi:predicted phage terminase large subunit-like protein